MNASGKLLGDPFHIRLNISHKRGQIITTSEGHLLKILKSYKLTWWRKVLRWFGVKLREPNTYKVKYIGQKLL